MSNQIFELFKIIEEGQENPKVKKRNNEKKKAKIGDKFSFKDLIEEDPKFLNDKVFKIDINEDNTSFLNLEQTYKYVHLKIKPLNEKKKPIDRRPGFNMGSGNSFNVVEESEITSSTNKEYFIQIIDISDRMLYNDAMAEQQFLEMINGAVSHELRNPLNSMIGQISSMQDFFENFQDIID